MIERDDCAVGLLYFLHRDLPFAHSSSESLVCCDASGFACDGAHSTMAGTCAARQRQHDAHISTKTLGTCVGELEPVLFHHAEREMGGSRCLKRSDAFQVNRL